MFGAYLTIFANLIDDQLEMQEKGKQKLEEIKLLWQDAAKYSRKKKKALRIKYQREYDFHYTLNKWHSEMFSF